MKNLTHSARALFTDARPGVHEKMWRIRAGSRALFAWEAEMADLKRLEELKPGAELFAGVTPLTDGSFRLHWLHVPGFGAFASRALSGRAKQEMEAVQRGETDACPPLESLRAADPDAGAEQKFIADLERAPAPDSPATLYRAEGEAVRIKADSGIRLMPKARMDPYLSYAFTCAGRQLHFTFSNEKSLASPLHPFFIAEGDRVRAVVGHDERTIQALLNLEDGCRYLRTVGAYASRRWLRQQLKNALGVCASIIAAVSLAFVTEALSLKFFLAAGGVALFVGLVLGLGAWLENILGAKFGRGRADLLRILDALDVTPDAEGKLPYVHMLEARYPKGRATEDP